MGKAPDAEKDEYVFRYRLRREDEEADAPYFEDHLLEMIRQQLANLLNVVVPMCHGKEVKIDGFKLLSDLDTIHDIFPICTEGDQKRGR